jgi:hypothetical protein
VTRAPRVVAVQASGAGSIGAVVVLVVLSSRHRSNQAAIGFRRRRAFVEAPGDLEAPGTLHLVTFSRERT